MLNNLKIYSNFSYAKFSLNLNSTNVEATTTKLTIAKIVDDNPMTMKILVILCKFMFRFQIFNALFTNAQSFIKCQMLFSTMQSLV
jgi:hypothetical protein